MMKRLFIIYFIFTYSFINICAQAIVEIHDINIINLGDGQKFAHRKDETKTPLQGKIRLITGITTEYIDTDFKDGYIDGKWEYYENNKLIESTTYKDGYLDGEYIKLSTDGDILLIGNYLRGKKEGTWDEFSSAGDRRSTMTYKGDSKIRQVDYYLDGSVKTEKNFKDGKEDGVYRLYTYEDHEVKIERNYVAGKQVGKQFIWYTSNQNDYYQYSNYNKRGRLDGDFLEKYINGGHIKQSGKYIDGLKTGKWIYGEPDGTIYKEEIYEKGLLVNNKNK